MTKKQFIELATKIAESFNGCPLRDDIKEQLMTNNETAEMLVAMDASANTTLKVFMDKLTKELGA